MSNGRQGTMLVKDVKEREKGLRAMIELSGVIHLKTLGGGGAGLCCFIEVPRQESQ